MALYKQDEKLQAFYNSFLKELLRRPLNSVCADCGERNPRFVSVKLGVFVCNRCYGVHRSIGAHVTRTKCIGLDAWLPEEIALVRDVGNEGAAAYWERNAPSDRPRPSPESPDNVVEKWIRDKYERRLFCDPSLPPPRAGPVDDLLAPPQKKQPTTAAAAAGKSNTNASPKSPPPPAQGTTLSSAPLAHPSPATTSTPSQPTFNLMDADWDFQSTFSTGGAPAAASQTADIGGVQQSPADATSTGGGPRQADWATDWAWPPPQVPGAACSQDRGS